MKGTNHALALGLWDSGWYEARLRAAFVGDPSQLTLAQMNQWADEFDNWAVVDTVWFSLFDRSSHAWMVIPRWAKAEAEFKKRAALALIWSLTVHDSSASDRHPLSTGQADSSPASKKARQIQNQGHRGGTPMITAPQITGSNAQIAAVIHLRIPPNEMRNMTLAAQGLKQKWAALYTPPANALFGIRFRSRLPRRRTRQAGGACKLG
jgi:hypothetical protein